MYIIQFRIINSTRGVKSNLISIKIFDFHQESFVFRGRMMQKAYDCYTDLMKQASGIYYF